MALFHELRGLFRFYLKVVLCGAGSYPHMLQLHYFLRLPLFLLLLLLLIPEFVVGEDAGDGGSGGGGDLDKVEPQIGGPLQRFREGKDAEIFTVRVYDPEFPRGYLIIDSIADVDMV